VEVFVAHNWQMFYHNSVVFDAHISCQLILPISLGLNATILSVMSEKGICARYHSLLACQATELTILTWLHFVRLACRQVCMDADVSMALQPCGHVCVCEACAGPLKDCPMCRADIASVLHVYLS